MRRLVLVLIGFVVLGGCSVGAGLAIRAYLADPGRAEAGDCLADDAGVAVPYRKVDCDDKAARYTVLTAVEADANPCVDVPGASRLYRVDRKVFCAGRKGANPVRAANVAKDGDCLRIGRGIESERLDCADPMANVKVLRRLTNVHVGGSPYLNKGPCAEIAGTQLVYSYEWQTNPPAKPVVGSLGSLAELVFCLVRANEPPPAVPDATRDCRYVTGQAVLAAVNATNGTRHIAVNPHMAGPLGCSYELTRDDRSARDSIMIKLGADTIWPPSGTQEFDLDGTKAAWHDSIAGGGGTLYVDRPTGRFEITLVVGNGFTAPRETAIAIYRTAAKHVP